MDIDSIQTCDFLKSVLDDIALKFSERAQELDETDTFAKDNYQDLKRHNVFSAMVPVALGGGGVSYSDMAGFLGVLAQNCSSTAWSSSMHQHLIATNIVNHVAGKPSKALLRKVSDAKTVLVSTGAKNWLTSNGEAVKVNGGYEITAAKHFSSGSPAGEILVTSAISHPDQGDGEVIHFAVPMSADGITLADNWRAMGMRASGSQSIMLDRVFVSEDAITLRRPSGPFHPLYFVVLSVGLSLIMSVYLGIAKRAAKLAVSYAKKRRDDPIIQLQVGEMVALLTTAQLAHEHMVSMVAELSFTPSSDIANQMLIRKTIVSRNVLETCEKAVEIAGGAGYLRSAPLERLLRDAHASQFHPLPEKQQQMFSGRLSLGLELV